MSEYDYPRRRNKVVTCLHLLKMLSIIYNVGFKKRNNIQVSIISIFTLHFYFTLYHLCLLILYFVL